MGLTRAQKRRLPKARLLWFRWWGKWDRSTIAKFRNANAMFVWIGPLEIGWRMPWKENSARACHPELFEDHHDH